MQIECNDNDGFSDQLSNDRIYAVKEIGSNGYLIESDQSQDRWYGASKFSIINPG